MQKEKLVYTMMARLHKFHLDIEFHPGVELKEKVFEMGLTPTQFARQAGMSVKTIKDVMACKIPVTAQMAVVFERLTKIPAYFWVNTQSAYDKYMVRKARQAERAAEKQQILLLTMTTQVSKTSPSKTAEDLTNILLPTTNTLNKIVQL